VYESFFAVSFNLRPQSQGTVTGMGGTGAVHGARTAGTATGSTAAGTVSGARSEV
jgi:hypothetical protein